MRRPVATTNKETINRDILVPDTTREQFSDTFLDEKPKQKWKANQHDVQEDNEGRHYGVIMNHSRDKNDRPDYEDTRRKIDGNFLRRKWTDDQTKEVKPEHSKDHLSTGSFKTEDFVSANDTVSDKKTVHEDPPFGKFQHNNTNWHDDRTSRTSDSSIVKQTETNSGESLSVERITGEEALSGSLRSFSRGLHVQSNHPTGKKKKKKKKCNEDTADKEYHTDKETYSNNQSKN